MSKYTAEQARSSLQKMHGHPLTVAERAELFSMASNYADLLRERESAKAGVTDALVHRAYDAMEAEERNSSCTDISAMRAALEAVAPMLASARMPSGLRERINRAWHDHDEDGRVSISMGDAKVLVEQVLAAAPNPEKE